MTKGLFGLLIGSVIWGQVVGVLQEGGVPLPGMRVWWSGEEGGTVTDRDGRFRLPMPARWPAWLRSEATPESLQVEGPPTTPLVWEVRPAPRLPTQVIAQQGPAIGLSPQAPQALQTWSRQALTAAPCCNLSEAFEGTALVDAAYSDGGLGVKQLRLLGFEPAHSPLSYENKPLSLGLYRPWSAAFLPALWVQNLAVAKGIGSVVSGFDGAAGQIQVQYLSSDESARAIEAFARSPGEFFLASRWQGKWKHRQPYLILTNAGWTPWQSAFLQDHNGDGFLDIPLYRHGHGLIKVYRKDSTGGLAEAEAEGLWDYRWGGQVAFREPGQIAALTAWGTYQGLRMGQISLRRGWVKAQGRGLSLLMQGRFYAEELQAGFNRYTARQPLLWGQFIYRLPIGDTRWLLQTGLEGRTAHYAESLATWHGYDTSWTRPEAVGGAFTEFTLTPSPQLSVVLGGRADWHSYWGWQAAPRLHLRWQYHTTGAVRLSGGRAWRVPDPMAETFPFLMSNRLWRFHFPGWPAVEESWSYGFFWQQSFSVGSGILRLSADGVQAHLRRALLWNLEQPGQIQVFSADRPALYQTLYGEILYEVPDRLRLLLSYKHQEVWWPLGSGKVFRPLLPRDRAVLWASWLTLSRRWQADAIVSWTGPQRLPATWENPQPTYTPAYALLTLQLTHRIDQWEIQLAGENLNNFRQSLPVRGAKTPFAPSFDAALVWGPIMGRVGSLTLRYTW